jgi:Arc/MetJ family transcription regulator
MRTTVTIDDQLLADARFLSGVEEVGPLIRKALTDFVQREASRRLALLEGTQPNLAYIPRRRSEPDPALESQKLHSTSAR